VLAARDQAGLGEHIEVLHDGRQRHRKRPRQLAHRQAFLTAEPRQQRPAGRVGKRRKGAVEHRLLILNHQVKF
jgi:hypothetical protein